MVTKGENASKPCCAFESSIKRIVAANPEPQQAVVNIVQYREDDVVIEVEERQFNLGYESWRRRRVTTANERQDRFFQ